jgi:hypothetical protein
VKPVEGQDPKLLAGWHHDPQGRFEYRYFNGVQWTSDVSIDGHRYVDTPVAGFGPAPDAPHWSRGLAITSFITGASGVVLGWVPFVFVVAAAAAVAAIVFGVLGLKAARRQNGYGRGFAVAGLALAPVALAVCVGGFFFTKATVRELRDFVDPGPHTLFVQQPCTVAGGKATLHGTIRNLDDRDHDYRLIVEFTSTSDSTKLSTTAVRNVGPGDTVDWSSSADISGSSVTCRVTDVFGPAPFDVDLQS